MAGNFAPAHPRGRQVLTAMISPTERPAWASRQFISLVLLVAIIQLALIFWLGDRDGIRPRAATPPPTLHWIEGEGAELIALRDPTLFALPHQEGFAGLAWLKAAPPPLPRYEWAERPHWLALDTNRLGQVAGGSAPGNLPAVAQVPPLPLPELSLPEVPPMVNPIQGSTSWVEGDPQLGQLTGPPDLPTWPPRVIGPNDVELLTNSIVQMMVGPDGIPLSVTLLQPGSGSRAADDFALAKAREARFKPLPTFSRESMDWPKLADLRWGRLVFAWQTRAPASPTP